MVPNNGCSTFIVRSAGSGRHFEYIAKNNLRRAISFVAELRSKIDAIGRNPYIYALRPEHGEHIRAMSFGTYVVLFRIAQDVVYVERVASGYRDLPKLLR